MVQNSGNMQGRAQSLRRERLQAMRAENKKGKTGFSREKVKWTVVAVLSVILILVLYYNRSGYKKEVQEKIQPKKTGVSDYVIPAEARNTLRPPAPQADITDDENRAEPLRVIRNIFDVAPRIRRTMVAADAEAEEPESEDLVLQGTIVDKRNSVVFINNQVLGIGDTFEGYTVVRINDGSAVLRRGEKEITIMAEESSPETEEPFPDEGKKRLR